MKTTLVNRHEVSVCLLSMLALSIATPAGAQLTVESTVPFGPSGVVYDFKVGDIDGDGLTDVFVAVDDQLALVDAYAILNEGTSFGPAISDALPPMSGFENFSAPVDIDGDGDGEIFYWYQNDTASLLTQTNGAYELEQDLNDPMRMVRRVKAADVDNNGIVDFITAQLTGVTDQIVVHRYGQPLPNTLNSETAWSVVAFGDARAFDTGALNADSNVDIAVLNLQDQSAHLLFGDGSAGFTQGGTVAMHEESRDIQLADFNGDGFADLFSLRSAGFPFADVYMSTGALTYAAPITVHIPGMDGLDVDRRRVQIIDLDQDGQLDLIHPQRVGGVINQVRVLFGPLDATTPRTQTFEVDRPVTSFEATDLWGTLLPELLFGVDGTQGTPTASLRVMNLAASTSTDFNGDNAVDSTDLAILLAAWGTPGADLNGDFTTDSADLAILLAAWGPVP